jgi:hypothetical protein
MLSRSTKLIVAIVTASLPAGAGRGALAHQPSDVLHFELRERGIGEHGRNDSV